jgi:hypothetical protein
VKTAVVSEAAVVWRSGGAGALVPLVYDGAPRDTGYKLISDLAYTRGNRGSDLLRSVPISGLECESFSELIPLTSPTLVAYL